MARGRRQLAEVRGRTLARSTISHVIDRLARRNRFQRGVGSLASQWMRYWHVVGPYLAPKKLANFLLCHAEMALRRRRVQSTPYILRIESSNICNLRCVGCATGRGINPIPKQFLSVPDFQRVLDIAAPHLLLTRFDGLGEPLLHPKIVDLIAFAHRRGSPTALSSHFGEQTLKPGMAGALVEAGLDYVIVPLDGPDQETYERYRRGGRFDLVCEHVRELVAAKRARKSTTPLIEIQFIGFDHNRHLAGEVGRLARALGADRIRWNNVHPDALRERRAHDCAGHMCVFLYNSWTIGVDGALKLCPNAWADTEPLPNVFQADPRCLLDHNHPYIVALREYLAGERRPGRVTAKLGDLASRDLPYTLVRGPNLCRCLCCATTGLTIDRTREWIRDYVCM